MSGIKRILLVTEKCKAHSLPLLLTGAGYDVLEPRVPSEAPKMVGSATLDLVIIGHCVPVRQREIVAQLIHQLRPDLPIICVTENPLHDRPTSGAISMTSCATILWAIEKCSCE